jgi:hypothetical protein
MLKVFPYGYDNKDPFPQISGGTPSLFLHLTDWEKFPSKRAVNASMKIRILDQLNNKNYEKSGNVVYH